MRAMDQYLCNGCKMISDVFEHSPLYRIGGHEFLAVLQEQDYKNRDVLTALLREKAGKANEGERTAEGGVSMATGIAVYDPETDMALAEVIQRAVSDAEKRRRK